MNRGNLAEDPKGGLPSSSRYSRMDADNRLLYTSSLSRKGARSERNDSSREADSSLETKKDKEKKKSVGRSLSNGQMSRLEVGSDGRLFGVFVTEKMEEAGKAGTVPAILPGSIPSVNDVPSVSAFIRSSAKDKAEAGSDQNPDAGGSTAGALVYSAGKEKDDASYLQAESIGSQASKDPDPAPKTGSALHKEAEGQLSTNAGTEAELETLADSSKQAGENRSQEKKADSSAGRTSSQKSRKVDRPYLSDDENPLMSRKTLERVRANRNKGPEAGKGADNSSAAAAAGVSAAASLQAPSVDTVSLGARMKAGLSSFRDRYRTGIFVSIAAVLAAAYIYTGYHFSSHFYPRTDFFGISSGGMTVEEVKAAAQARVASYELSIFERDSSGGADSRHLRSSGESVPVNLAYEWGRTAALSMQEHMGSGSSGGANLAGNASRNVSTAVLDTVSARQIGLCYDDNGEIEEAMDSQIPALWPVMMIVRNVQDKPYLLNTYYDSSAAKTVVDGLSCFDENNIVEPVDATIAYGADKAYVSKEVMGTLLDTEAAKAAVFDALDNGVGSIDFQKLGLYKDPEVYSDDPSLNKEVRRLNKVLGTDMIIDFADRSEELNAEKTVSLISSKENGKYYIDEEKVRSYVSSLAERFNTIGVTRTFYTSLGSEVELTGGNYGWELDQDACYEEILSALKNKKHGTLEPVYTQTAMSRLSNDIGDTYIEINISNQRMWMYHDGELIVDTPVVTGDPLRNNATPSGGVWRVFDIQRNTLLSGVGYVTPVDYWVGFNGGVGIHDLQSRYYFGGQVYLGAGSHGCVNTPLSAVKLVFQAADYGMPVVVYEDESQAALDARTGAMDVNSINYLVEQEFGTVEDDGQGSIVQWTAKQKYQAAAAASTVSSS